ncbi:MAG: hypothetical protein KR126chlam4_01429 [Candidatus Anoxychlamydiales bacterium]|nr:hypothetical protein [Candidatus Anoxychlamydiales bacterium]NGX41587.1 hypothetical protein [Candidatus Anoxychlamydiales bacterium]
MNHLNNFIFIFLFLFSKAFSIVVGNPSDPGLYLDGFFSSNEKVASFRASYLYNNIYKQEFKNNVNLQATSDVKMKIFASVLTFNFFNRLDLYAILGKANYEFTDVDDALFFQDDNFAWGAGFKLILFKGNKIDFSFDGKYFSTKQRANSFVLEKLIYTLDGPFRQRLEEVQGSFAISYKTNFLIPYVGATFLYTLDTEFFPHSRIIPKPLVRIISRGDNSAIFETRDMKPKDLFGAVLGISIINNHKNTTLNLETRVIDQNAFAFVGTLRF